MIVIVIMGVVYTLAVSKLKNASQDSEPLDFLHLKEYLVSFIGEDARSARLVCLDECEECSIYVDGEKVHSFESFFDADVKSYRYDFLEGMREVQKSVFFDVDNLQQDLCFSLSIDKRGISEQLFILHKDRVYDFTTYLEPTKEYGSLDEVVQAKERLYYKVMQ